MVSFKGPHYPKSVTQYAVYFYVRFAVSYRDLEEIMAARGVDVDHATLNQWVEKYSVAVASEARCRKAPTGRFWRMDENYVKVKGRWTYLYRAIDKCGTTFAFMLSERRDEAAGLFNMNCLLVIHNWCWLLGVLQVKYLNKLIEQDHRFIKKITRPMQTFKSFTSAAATLAGIEVAHMIRKGQFDRPGKSGFEQFAGFAGSLCPAVAPTSIHAGICDTTLSCT